MFSKKSQLLLLTLFPSSNVVVEMHHSLILARELLSVRETLVARVLLVVCSIRTTRTALMAMLVCCSVSRISNSL